MNFGKKKRKFTKLKKIFLFPLKNFAFYLNRKYVFFPLFYITDLQGLTYLLFSVIFFLGKIYLLIIYFIGRYFDQRNNPKMPGKQVL